MKPHIPFRIPRPEAVSVALVVAVSLSLPALQYLNYEISRYVPLHGATTGMHPTRRLGQLFSLLIYQG